MTKPAHFTVYGVDHSPWVQAVCIFLQVRKLPYKLISMPPGLAEYRRYGFVMPQCRFDDGTVVCGSSLIMAEIERRYLNIEPNAQWTMDDLVILERFFLSFALSRTGNHQVVDFILAWAKMRNDAVSLKAAIVRAFMCLYFLILITGGRIVSRRRGFDPDSSSQFNKSLHHLVQRLNASKYFGGDQPSYFDFALYGLCQCLCTGLTDSCMLVFKENAELVAWLSRMNSKTPGYLHDYTHRLFQVGSQIEFAHLGERWVFWFAFFGMVLLAPLTFLMLLDAFRRRTTNPNRSGAVVTHRT